jgi:hypothetical protein
MSKAQAAQAAANFLRDQAAIMKKYGEAPKLSGPRYTAAKNAATRTFQTISSTKTGSAK